MSDRGGEVNDRNAVDPQPQPSRLRSPQPNITGVGLIASYSLRFWAVLMLTSVVAGFGGGALVELLHLVERVAYSQPHATSVIIAAEHSARYRRVLALLLAAVIIVVANWLLGRASTGGIEVSEAIWLRSGRLPFISSVARGLVSIVTVGLGVSLGREAAPQALGAATASALAERGRLPVWQRRLLVACGAGAGFAAVYNVPLGGALLALEVMLGTIALPLALPALLSCAIATVAAWVILGNRAVYDLAGPHFAVTQLAFAILIAPLAGLAAVLWTRMLAAANSARPTGAGRFLAPFIALGALGVVSLAYPQLLGNGRGIVQLVLVGRLSFGMLLLLLALKPSFVAACLTSGAPGGLFTPTLAVGALLAGVVNAGWAHIWPGSGVGADVLIGAGAFLAAAMQGPISGTVLVLELTGHIGVLMVPTLIAVVGATMIARRLGAASIYSARLADGAVVSEVPSVQAAAIAALTVDEAGRV